MPTNPNPLNIDLGAMTRSEFDAACKNFDDHFKISGIRSVELEEQKFEFGDLDNLASVLPATDRLIIVHFGLYGDTLRYGFSFVKGTRNGDSLDYTDYAEPTHILYDSKFEPIDDAAVWDGLRKAYLEKIKVERTDAAPAFVGLTPFDALRVVLPWDDEVELMYEQNIKDRRGPFKMVLDSVSTIHAADPLDVNAPVGYRHSVAFYLEERTFLGYKRLLEDPANPPAVPPAVATYRDRAADYGNLCPVRCGKYTPPA